MEGLWKIYILWMPKEKSGCRKKHPSQGVFCSPSWEC